MGAGEGCVMYKRIFVINIIIYMCLQHSNVHEFKIAVFLSLRERFAPQKNLLPYEFYVGLCLHKQVVDSF